MKLFRINQLKLSTQKGQMSIPVQVVWGVVLTAVGWTSSYFGNISAQQKAVTDVKAEVVASISSLDKRVSVNENIDLTQQQLIETTTKKLDTLDKNIVKLLIANNIQPAQ